MKKALLRGITDGSGNLAPWIGLPVGFGTPLIVSQVTKGLAQAELVKQVANVTKDFDLSKIETGVAAVASKAMMYKWITLASPFVLALPFLLFKKTRGAALGIIGGGIVGDLVLSYWPAASASTPTAEEKPVEGAQVQILGGR